MSRTRLATLGLALCLALPAGAEGPTPGPTVTLAFVGDINLDGLPGNLVRRGGDPFATLCRTPGRGRHPGRQPGVRGRDPRGAHTR